jgi:hypothetical protein
VVEPQKLDGNRNYCGQSRHETRAAAASSAASSR